MHPGLWILLISILAVAITAVVMLFTGSKKSNSNSSPAVPSGMTSANSAAEPEYEYYSQ